MPGKASLLLVLTAVVASARYQCQVSNELGCFNDHNRQLGTNSSTVLMNNKMTRELCMSFCFGLALPLAGVEGKKGNQCYCGEIIEYPEEKATGSCNIPCAANKKETCGGDWAVTIFNYTCAVAPTPPPTLPPPPPPTPPTPPPSPVWPSIHDPRRKNQPKVAFALQPLQWGSVTPQGWIREWAQAARNGAVSPTKAAFATLQDGKVDGWRNGRPAEGGFWDEDSAYWIDGMTRLGLVLHDKELLDRVKEDFDYVLKYPWNFHNTWAHDAVEGWVRSIYSRGMLAYYDGTGDESIIPFLQNAYANYTPADSTHKHQDQEHQVQ
jgi:hypothetical protein